MLIKGEYERLREPVENPSYLLYGVGHTEIIQFLSCKIEWSTWSSFKIHKTHVRKCCK